MSSIFERFTQKNEIRIDHFQIEFRKTANELKNIDWCCSSSLN